MIFLFEIYVVNYIYLLHNIEQCKTILKLNG